MKDAKELAMDFMQAVTRKDVEDFLRAVQADALRSAANACERRYMGDNNREDMEARRCAEAVRALMPRDV